MKNSYTVMQVGSKYHVLTPVYGRYGSLHREPNYLGTGKALCGVLKKGESLEQWKKRTGKK